MPLLNSFQAALGGVLVILIYGIVVEKHYVSRATVFYNILSFLLLLASIDIPWLLFILLLVYLLLGMIVMRLHVKQLFPLFGARTYGALALVLILEGNKFIPGLGGRDFWEMILILILYWAVTALLVHLLGYLYKKHS